MKNQHLMVPLILVVAAVIIGFSTMAVHYSSTPEPVAVGVDNTVATAPEALVSVVSVSADTAAAADAGSRLIKWQSSNYPANGTVTINLIEKVGENPTSYEFIRAIAENTANDGSESWVPEEGEAGDTLYIEVVCGSGPTGACRSGSSPVRAF